MNDAFWTWWFAHRGDIAAGIDGGGIPDDIVDGLREQVDAIHPSLAWELSPGTNAEHALVVTSGGNPELRAIAERWRRSAPPPDETWEYHATRQPSYGDLATNLKLDGREVDLKDLVATVEIEEDLAEVDVTIHHPAFAELGEAVAQRVAFLALDWLLGEEGVERWIGTIDVAEERPPNAAAFRSIVDAVHDLEREEQIEWVVLSAEDDDGLPIRVTAARPLKPVEHPLLDTHVSITLRVEGRGDGMPDEDELSTLLALEDDLEGELGDDALLAAHVTHAGERTFELYVDGMSEAPERLRRWAHDHGAGFDIEHDPAWDAVRPFR